jgi:single-strand DNA-binding protein
MAGVNKAILVGHLGKDPEVRTLENGVKVARFSVATTESYKDKNTGQRVDNTEWHNVTVWRGLADVAENYLKKGAQVYVEGKIQTRSYEQEGITKYSTDIVARELTMLGKKGDNMGGNEASGFSGNTYGGTTANAQKNSSAAVAPAFPSVDEEEDDLPF